MKFKFSFEAVLRYRRTLEEIAQTEFAEAMAELNKQKQILSDMQEETARARENIFQKQQSGGKAAPALSQGHEFLKGQDLRMERQQIKIQEWQVKVEELQEVLRLKAIDHKIIEELRNKKKEEFRIEQNKREQKNLDQLNTMRFKPEGRQS